EYRGERFRRIHTIAIHTAREIDRKHDIGRHLAAAQSCRDGLWQREHDRLVGSSRKILHHRTRGGQRLLLGIKYSGDRLEIAYALEILITHLCSEARSGVSTRKRMHEDGESSRRWDHREPHDVVTQFK